MEKRRLGRTDHHSTVAIFGAAAFYEITQEKADQAMELVLESGINHIDVAPGYGQAEERLGSWMETERKRFFLGCKTTERMKEGAAEELRHSLGVLKTDKFDLYQFHAVGSMAELDKITSSGGALEAVIQARKEGLVEFIGITGHGLEVPVVFLEAIQRFDFDTVLFPLNFILYSNPNYRRGVEKLLAECTRRDIGVMIIKSIAKGPWGEKPKVNTTWYEPFTEKEWIRQSIHFALSQPVTGICTAADVSLLPLVLEACGNFKKMSDREQDELVNQAENYEQLFT